MVTEDNGWMTQKISDPLGETAMICKQEYTLPHRLENHLQFQKHLQYLQIRTPYIIFRIHVWYKYSCNMTFEKEKVDFIRKSINKEIE